MNGILKLILVGVLFTSRWPTVATDTGCAFGYELLKTALEGIQLDLHKMQTSIQMMIPISSCRETKRNGVVQLNPYYYGGSPFLAFCDQTTLSGGWMVIQRRLNGAVNFNRNWTSYKEGFGKPEGEYWIGLENIHRITRYDTYELLVVLKDFDGMEKEAKYKTFSVASEDEQYKLEVGQFVGGCAGDSFSYHNGMKFSTPDRDNDLYYGHCAAEYSSGWWFAGGCYSSNVNGLYKKKGDETGIEWRKFNDDWKCLMEARMMIRMVK